MPDRHNKIRITLTRRHEMDGEDGEHDAPVSVYMYIAGLVVSLTGMYAATYDMEDTRFALILRALTICGYLVSYWMRKMRIDLRQFQAPLLVIFATVMYFVSSTAPGGSGPAAPGGATRPYQIQNVIVWIAILQSYTLCTDAAILFACVPTMALLGIMSSGTPDDEVQYAFYVFVAATTFLMVHENQVRTRSLMRNSRDRDRDRDQVRSDVRTFRGELGVVCVCVVATMVLARVVAAPVEVVGRAVLPASAQDFNRDKNKQSSSNTNIRVEEENTLDLGTGPRTEQETPLIEFTCPYPVTYWRGMTYDYYAGNRFEDRLPGAVPVSPTTDSISQTNGGGRDNELPGGSQFLFRFDPLRFDPGDGQMQGSTEVKQSVVILAGTMTHLYGLSTFKSVQTSFFTLNQSEAGGVSTETPLIKGVAYQVTSQVPTSDPAILKHVPTTIPAGIKERYLQVSTDSNPKSVRLQAFVDTTIKGCETEYDKVVALRTAVSSRCTYNLQTPAIPRNQDVVETFLFDTKQGYCDSFAASFTVLCRYAGVPARVASGFLAGDVSSNGDYIVKEKHKHVWTEVFFPHVGWVSFDATAGSRSVSGTTTAIEKGTASSLKWLTSHGPFPVVIALAILGMLAYLINTELISRLKRRQRVNAHYLALPAGNQQVVALYNQACGLVARVGPVRSASTTPLEYFAQVQEFFVRDNRPRSVEQVVASLESLTRMHGSYAYGIGVATPEEVLSARSEVTRLKSVLRSVPRSARAT